MTTGENFNLRNAVKKAAKNALGEADKDEDSIYLKSELYADFMRFAFEKGNKYEESKIPVELY